MTIYGVGYRPLVYSAEPVAARLRAIVGLEFRTLFRSRWGVALFLLCLGPSVVSLVVLLVQMGVLQFGPPRLLDQVPQHLPDNPEVLRFWPTSIHFYLEPIVLESLAPFLILTALVSSRAIAKDKAANALELYWTRGISARGYFLAKWLGSLGLLAVITVGAPLLLWLLGVLVAPDWDYLAQTVRFMPRLLLALAAFTVVLSYLPIAFSALAGAPNLASVLWCMLVVGSTAVGHVLAELLRDPSWLPVVSVWDAAGTLARWIAGLQVDGDTVSGALTNVLGLTALLTVLMLRRLRLQEAVG